MPRSFFPLSRIFVTLAAVWSGLALSGAPTETERRYLSGHGPEDAVPWDFTVTGGRRAGEATTIPVPSQWEQHGFGTYNYGQEAGPKGNEHGLYRLRFAVPETWKGQRIRLVFEGVMTDATVKVNGRLAGPTHQGGFYRFNFDVTSTVKFGDTPENELEVDVAKVSSNLLTETAERGGDYWVFGGIFRPVWLEAAPMRSIEQVAIDARADGNWSADVTVTGALDKGELSAQVLDAQGQAVGGPTAVRIPAGGAGRVRVAARVDTPHLWTAETPALYSLRITLRNGDEVLHRTTSRFGFRTFEVRPGQGLFLNGQRILLKGANRHSFRPDTGRTLSREDCYADARLLRSLNMNAVRMSHYPPDEAFLEACDELGLYVLDELSGWQHAHDTQVGRLLVRAMVERDVNHPSILFWDNGNEGGWNRELDGEFAFYDPQNRRVLHPWELHDDVDTKHYPNYEDITRRLRGPNLVMPTEFLHALYDGGGGAGLEDYWNAIATSPFGAGGFIWALFDEGIARTDQGGRIDVFSTYAPDGIVGPRQEKEGSYYTVRDLWSPVQITPPVLDDKFSGQLAVANHYDFTSLADCRFAWKLVRFRGPSDPATSPQVLGEGTAVAPAIAPHGAGSMTLALPATWRDADALLFTALDPRGQELWTWSWPTVGSAARAATPSATSTAAGAAAPKIEVAGGEIRLIAGPVTASFDASTGLLLHVSRGEKSLPLSNGPRLAFSRAESAGEVTWLSFANEDPASPTRRLATAQPASLLEIELDYAKTTSWAGFKLELSPDGTNWKTIYDGTRRSGDGKRFNFPPQPVLAVRLSNLHRSDGQPIAVKSVRLGYAPARFPDVSGKPAAITHGTAREAGNAGATAWLESTGAGGLDRFRWTLHADGSLGLDYAYTLNGDFLYHGVTFSQPEETMTSLRWLGEGPYRTWQNRRRGSWLGVHEIAHQTVQPGEAWGSPEFQGYFASLRWAQLETTSGPLTVSTATPDLYFRVGTPRIDHQNTTADFPAGDLSLLHAIPAIGSKFITPANTGPHSQPAKASGTYRGSLRFEFGENAPEKR
jgi:hypothetical protein